MTNNDAETNTDVLDVETAVAMYFAMWNEHDPATRRSIIEQLWTADAVSADPLTVACGHEAIDAMVAGVQSSMPPHRFDRVGEIAHHADRILYFWTMTASDASVLVAGLDAVRVAADGRFADLAGFFGPTPSPAMP